MDTTLSTEALEHYNNPEVKRFCEMKGVLPPPFWSPTGTDGTWTWDEDIEYTMRGKTTVCGSWKWVADEAA